MVKIGGLTAIILLLTSCTGGLYSHYPKVKHTPTPKQAILHKHTIRTTEAIGAKQITFQANTIDNSIKYPLEGPVLLSPKKNTTTTAAPPKRTPADVTPTNGDAKFALVAAIGALGTFVLGIAINPILLIVSFVCALAALYFGRKALRQIRKTGEYGRRKAEFAVMVAIPILIFTLAILLAWVFWGSTGIQIGNVTLF